MCVSSLLLLTPNQPCTLPQQIKTPPASSNPHLPPIPRINTIHARIHPLQLRTAQPRQVPRNVLRQRLQRRRQVLVQARQHRRRLRLHELEGEAGEVVALGQGGAVEDAVGQGGHVEAGEGVRGARVAADGEEARVLEGVGEDVEDEAGGFG